MSKIFRSRRLLFGACIRLWVRPILKPALSHLVESIIS
ncbi:hypothetical protein AVDCRST_MAG84-3835 [uncultured Microcoleus sp.]|uniref:Uncharacterized protein n=1 Tax=uncultured Microcoleus sp. TaxID=259945 RepID=A0A6J4MT50_9CYAN|nr:hypothetical protein AVDCRST_MAG84-3835 [uncultured Microcoleus sp.]